MGKNNEKFLFEKIFRENQNKIAIETVDQKISFNDLKLKVFSLIEYFKSNGLKKKTSCSCSAAKFCGIYLLLSSLHDWWIYNLPN